jgi:hypothetical protein
MGGAGATWRYGHGWLRAVAVALLAGTLIAEGIAFGGGRISAVQDPLGHPEAFVLVVEVALGAVLPWLLLARDERAKGYLATVALAIIGALAIGPVTEVIRGVADRF